ncbi:MAG: aminoacyl-histidine dipeptidase [Massilibacteroides sp.]|nr:aminoacyl-histidine dipeptidase [Massilibacteroides sp.]MDD3061404.1 aminoacyl-histidine dipeptidase [Massilibacteroides sp.]MDD4659495.1 aminoacyl-histidine dipeptidase [Massilibacteroides sp.]
MKITDLNPKIVWSFFHEITQIPRPSKKEEKIIQYLESFAKKYNIAIKKDKVGNILMSKPATRGYENRTTVILQSHVDMVCEKNSGTEHDFENDPIETIVEGDWLHAQNTTLGADNGVGVAAELAILASNNIEHGPIECLFTIDEETGLTGAKALKVGFMTGEILLNLDSEDEGEIFIGCAGGKDSQGIFQFTPMTPDTSLQYFRIEVKGLNGGHSGGEIHKGLGNANKILVRFLYLLKQKYEFTVCEINGGNLRNAIAREAHAIIGIPANAKEDVRVMLNHFTTDIENELKHVDKNVKLLMESVVCPAKAIDPVTAEKLIYSLQACPHGVIGMSHEIEGLVETSTNLASIKTMEDNSIVVGTSQRSSIESCKIAVANQVAATFLLAGAAVTHGDGYPGWAPNADSPIMQVAQESYKRLFGKEAAIKAIHAGLECGLFLEKYPHLDMISFGPTLRDVHSPNERIQISTVGLWWKHLLDILKHIPVK